MRTVVAVYGSLRQGCHNAGLLRGAKFLGTTMTSRKWLMINCGSYPALLDHKHLGAHIVVELYEVDNKTLRRLDQLEGIAYGFYDRITAETDLGPAQMYIQCKGKEEIKRYIHQKQYVKSGDWLEVARELYREGLVGRVGSSTLVWV